MKKKGWLSALLILLFNSLLLAQNPVAGFKAERTCLNDSSIFTDQSTGAIVSRHWDFGDGFDTWQYTSPIHRYAKIGNYTVKLTVYNSTGGFDTKTTNIEVFALPKVVLLTNPDSTITEGNSATISIQGSFNEYKWSTGSTSPTIAVDKQKEYSVTVTDENGCKNSKSITIVVVSEANPIEVMSNILTPNDDGYNEHLEIKDFDNKIIYPFSFQLQVYNIWNQQIYNNSDYQNNWDGEGHESGTYYYVLKTANKKTKIGSINILR